jgi:hypothetical protein
VRSSSRSSFAFSRSCGSTRADGYPGKYWRVSPEEAKRADSGVNGFLLSRGLPLTAEYGEYYGQIFGTTDPTGRKIIHLNYLCAEDIQEETKFHFNHLNSWLRPRWTHELIEVNDGGGCFFHLDFDPATQTYASLVVNAN